MIDTSSTSRIIDPGGVSSIRTMRRPALTRCYGAVTTPVPWRVILAVAPPLLQELLSELLSRSDLEISSLSSLERGPRQPRFDVGVIDRALPPWVQADRYLRVRVPRTDDVSTLAASQLVLDHVESLRYALVGLCPRRSISIHHS